MAPLPDTQPIRTYLSALFKRTPSPASSSSLTLSGSPKAVVTCCTGTGSSAQSNEGHQSSSRRHAPAECTQQTDFYTLWAHRLWIHRDWDLVLLLGEEWGFYFKESDWDEYKSTVLRRKGPNGTTLSGATATTDLGGGSVVHGEKNSKWGRLRKGRKGSGGRLRYKDFDEEGTLTGSGGGSALGSEMGELKYEALGGKKARKWRNRDARSEVTDFEPRMGARKSMPLSERSFVLIDMRNLPE